MQQNYTITIIFKEKYTWKEKRKVRKCMLSWKQTLFIINAWIAIYSRSCMHDQITCMRSDWFWLADFWERVKV